jgi:DnaJ-class molecular chaperone
MDRIKRIQIRRVKFDGVESLYDKAKSFQSFRDLAKHYHPDKNSSPGANQKFTEIQEAYDVLKRNQLY